MKASDEQTTLRILITITALIACLTIIVTTKIVTDKDIRVQELKVSQQRENG